jgi:opacity protein-like surface antigen
LNPEQFNRFGFDIGAGYQITEKLTATLGYNYIIRGSDQPGRDFQQNNCNLSFFYRF